MKSSSLSNAEHRSGGESFPVRTILWATISFGLLWTYVLCVGFLDETIAGIKVSRAPIIIAALAGFVFTGMIFIWIQKRRLFATTAIRDTALGVSTLVAGLLVLDVGYSASLNSSQPPRSSADERDERSVDPNTWVGELYPKLYFPTEKNFRLHKPGSTITGSHYGDMYRQELLASPVLSSSVFSKKHVTISINDDGFRETAMFEGHRIVALGDSFTFGWGIDQDRTWVELLERSIGEPVYNMGMHDSSPKQEFLLLEHIIGSRKLDLRGGLLLWMIFEGNDLEGSYDDRHPVKNSESTSGRLFRGTIIKALWDLPSIVKRESVFARFKDGRAEFSAIGEDRRTKSHKVIDGIASPFPLYVSSRYGAKLFFPDQLKRVQNPEQYVESHPNRFPLQTTFKQMESLANQAGFRVVVIIAPTDARLYGPAFEDFPNLSEKSYFNILVARLAEESGFHVIDLEEALRPYVTKELLYFRDDDHWNERGHIAVADILGGFLRPNIALLTEK